jgi:hypothetical protein
MWHPLSLRTLRVGLLYSMHSQKLEVRAPAFFASCMHRIEAQEETRNPEGRSDERDCKILDTADSIAKFGRQHTMLRARYVLL